MNLLRGLVASMVARGLFVKLKPGSKGGNQSRPFHVSLRQSLRLLPRHSLNGSIFDSYLLIKG